MTTGRENLRIQKWVVAVAVLLFIIKMVAFWVTRSVAILTDALESTVNVIAGFIGLYSLYVAAKPRDENHPYGHGKAEFLSAAVEGTLIIVAALVIIYEAVLHFIYPRELKQLDSGIILVASTAVVNFIVGFISIRIGKKNNSLALVASGKHLQTDTWSTLGIILGLVLIRLTRLAWLDSVTAIVFAFIIMYTGYHILRHSLAGIMDEADKELLQKMLAVLNANRRPNWIDLHNLRVIKYGGQYHIDCHLTVPWYLNVVEAHKEVEELGRLIKKEFGTVFELFVHTDACLDFSCPICTKEDCQVRRQYFKKKVAWTLENVLRDKKHSL
ncbi:cation diffusion facilitator family transporter [Niastella populi]|uniref:Cation diffusion facilitator family transporter n=1 Tax=Niastella populi TaxID=550983 RepID=A0A1V9EKY9_9BACT|nr:cation diffusion facilitator family transporter [Niastella populi]OQP46731.1 cation diffusion facilitator family transporter [Niastella populi]